MARIPKQKTKLLMLFLIVDSILIATCHIFSWYLRFQYNIFSIPYPEFVPMKAYTNVLPVVVFLWILIFALVGLYKNLYSTSLWSIVSAVTWGTIANASLTFVYRDYSYSRLAMGYNWLITISAIYLSRLIVYLIIRTKTKLFKTRIVLVGENLEQIKNKIEKSGSGYSIEGIIPDINNDLLSTFDKNDVSELIISLPLEKIINKLQVINDCIISGLKVKIVSPLAKVSSGRIEINSIADIPVIEFTFGLFDKWNRLLKRIIDLFLCVILAGFCIPIAIFLVFLIKIDSPGNVFFKQLRTGKNGRKFLIYKFRTMIKEAETLRNELVSYSHAEEPIFKMHNDPRITRVGKFLRKFYLDELPQIWNILKGEMSFVGPRPLPTYESEKLTTEQKRRLIVPPGVTGLWQITEQAKFSSVEMFKLDFEYIEKWTPSFDLKIMLKTLKIICSGKGI